MSAERIPLSAPDVGEAEVEAVAAVLRSGRLSLGPKLVEFERTLAGYAGTRDAVAVSSGTAGLHLALRALDVGPGDEVVTTPFSFAATAAAVAYVGARPVFADVDPESLNLDAEQAAAAVTPRTRAILPVHVFGRPAALAPLRETARRRGLRLIEDACEALGGSLAGRRLGAIGDAGVYAFYPNKPITTAEGGVLVSDDAALAARVRRLRNHGRDPGQAAHAELGYNYRLSELHAALGLAQLRRLDAILARREAAARLYDERLRGASDLVLPDLEVPGGRIGWFAYVVRLPARSEPAERDRIAAALAERGIGCGRYFAPLHLEPAFRGLGHRRGDFPVAEAAAARTLALPFFSQIRTEQIDEVCETLLRLCRGA